MSITLGIIAEDASDVALIEIFYKKLAAKPRKVFSFFGNGCGKILAKCRAWSEDLRRKGCQRLILVHDLDDRKLPDLQKAISDKLGDPTIARSIVVILIREIEAWLLADHSAIQTSLGLDQKVNVIPNPESILNPKEKLKEIVYLRSGKKKKYVNTVHNKTIAEACTLKALNRCSSFKKFANFVTDHCVQKKPSSTR